MLRIALFKCFCTHIHILKVNLEVAERSSYFTGAMEFNSLSCHIKSTEFFIKFSKDTKFNNLKKPKQQIITFLFVPPERSLDLFPACSVILKADI